MIQEAFSDDVIRTPLKVDGPALPGTEEWNPTSLKGRERASVVPEVGIRWLTTTVRGLAQQ
jgi:hypothetical protein